MKQPTQEFRFLTSGIDSLYVGYNYDLTGGQIDFDDLDCRKALLKDDPKRKAVLYQLGDLQFGLTPGGAYPYAHVLTHRDFRMKLARRMQPSCMVEYSSEGLWSNGMTKLTDQIAKWAQSLGLIALLPEAVSRLDYAFDYWLPNPDFAIDHFVSRSRKDNQWREHGNVQTLQFGSGDVVVRIYHKSAEIEQQSGKSWFYQIWNLDEQERKQVWRIEFQFRRAALRGGGIKSIADIQDQLGDILREAATGHTSLRSPSSDSNRSRWPYHPIWEDLLEQVSSLPQVGLCHDIHRKEALALRERRLMQSITGNLKALAALRDLQSIREKPPDIFETLDEVARFAERELHTHEWNEDVKDRIRKYENGQW